MSAILPGALLAGTAVAGLTAGAVLERMRTPEAEARAERFESWQRGVRRPDDLPVEITGPKRTDGVMLPVAIGAATTMAAGGAALLKHVPIWGEVVPRLLPAVGATAGAALIIGALGSYALNHQS